MAWPPQESCKITEAPDKTLRPPQVQESNRWPRNIVSSLTFPKFQLASFKLITNRWVWGWCLSLCGSCQQARKVTMTTLWVATTQIWLRGAWRTTGPLTGVSKGPGSTRVFKHQPHKTKLTKRTCSPIGMTKKPYRWRIPIHSYNMSHTQTSYREDETSGAERTTSTSVTLPEKRTNVREQFWSVFTWRQSKPRWHWLSTLKGPPQHCRGLGQT